MDGTLKSACLLQLIAAMFLLVGCESFSRAAHGGELKSQTRVLVGRVIEPPAGIGSTFTLEIIDVISGVGGNQVSIESVSSKIPSVAPYLAIVTDKSGDSVLAKDVKLIPVYDIGRDRFAVLEEFLEENDLSFYADGFDVDVLWLPVSCRDDDLSACREELQLFHPN